MKTLLLIAGLSISFSIFAQKKDRHSFRGPDKKFALFINTLSPLEPQQGAIGAGINYKIVRRWDVSLELNYLFEGFAQSADDYSSKGFRTIITGKHFSRSGVFFYGIDARVKKFWYEDRGNFINTSTNDTIYLLRHDANTTMIGGAGIVGLRLPISKNKRWAVEINTGVGIKYRDVQRKDIPAGYSYYHNIKDDSRHLNITNGQDIDGVSPYLPSAIRIMYFF